MLYVFRHYISPVKLGLLLADIGWAFVSFCLAIVWRQKDFLGGDLLALEIVFSGLAAFGLTAIFLCLGGYSSESLRLARVHFIRLSLAVFLNLLWLAALFYFFPKFSLWPSSLVFGSLAAAILISFDRLFVARVVVRYFPRRVFLLTDERNDSALEAFLKAHPELAMRLVGKARLPAIKTNMTRAEKQNALEISSLSEASSEMLQEIKIIETSLEKLNPDQVIIGGSGAFEASEFGLLFLARLGQTDVRQQTVFLEQARGYVDLEQMQAADLLKARQKNIIAQFEGYTKRGLDVFLSLLGLFLLSPVFLLVAGLVKLTSAGPVFYNQERVGMGGKSFFIHKFRTMQQDAEKISGPAWAAEKDPRITRVGRFLRQSRLDELPQFLNILKGDMSFVGPRPERPFFVEQLSRDIPFYQARHLVKPGLTGWAQVRFTYGASLEEARHKLEFDLYYIKNHSLFLDLLILMQTVSVVLFPKGVR